MDVYVLLLGNDNKGILSLVDCLGISDPVQVLIGGWLIDLFVGEIIYSRI